MFWGIGRPIPRFSDFLGRFFRWGLSPFLGPRNGPHPPHQAPNRLVEILLRYLLRTLPPAAIFKQLRGVLQQLLPPPAGLIRIAPELAGQLAERVGGVRARPSLTVPASWCKEASHGAS